MNTARRFLILCLSLLLVPDYALALQSSNTLEAKKVMAEARSLLQRRDFSTLQKTLETYLRSKEKIDDGQWKFHVAMDGIDGNAAHHQKDMETLEKNFSLVKDWVQEQPASTLAKTALANCWLSRAWAYRGSKFASETSSKQFETFEQNLRNAFQVLGQLDKTEDMNPELYMGWLNLALGAGMSTEATDAIYAKAKNAFPDYFYITLQYLVTKFKRWSSDDATLPRAINLLASDPELFARANWHLVNYGESLTFYDSTSHKVSQQGFSIIKDKYHSPLTVNQVAFLACFQWRDQNIARSALSEIKNEPEASLWFVTDNYKKCLTWANCELPPTK